MSSARNLTIGQLEKELAEKRGRVKKLTEQRAAIDREIKELVGKGTVRRRKPVKKAENPTSLKDAVHAILGKVKNGYPLAELAEKILAAGYKTNSKNFRNVLYQCVYNDKAVVYDDDSGTYKMK